jgi:hypothetical protein
LGRRLSDHPKAAMRGHLKTGHENRPYKERSRTLTAAGGRVAFRLRTTLSELRLRKQDRSSRERWFALCIAERITSRCRATIYSGD